MEIACKHCQGKFKVPDEKLPQGQVLSISCPKCKGKITIDTRTRTAETPQAHKAEKTQKTMIDEVAAGTYDASEKPFDFIEQGVKTALLCEPAAAVREKIKPIVTRLGFNATQPQTALEALKQMRFHVFDLIILNELFDAQDPQDNHIMQYLDHLTMGVRRNIFVALLSKTHRTMDNMAAFHRSVNLIINLNNLTEFEKILKRALADYESFYHVFRESMGKAGLI